MKLINTFVSFIAIMSILICVIFPVRVQAAEVESLPAFSNDIELMCDKNGIAFKSSRYDLYLSFAQSLSLDGVYVRSYRTDGTVSYFNSLPSGAPSNVNSGQFSYWFSESEARIYVFSALDSYFKVIAYNSGHFKMTRANTFSYLAMSYYDLNTGVFVPVFIESGDNVDNGDMCSYVDVDGVFKSIPSDLLCLFSSYNISGFYEANGSEVLTPDFYFKFRYLFYVENIGYTFVDSARPLINISNDDPMKAILTFSETCNKHIYISVNGITWTEHTDLDIMYSDTVSLEYSYFYDSPAGVPVYDLVYSNDDGYDDLPLVTPEYGDLEDVVSNLWDIVYYGGGFEGTGNFQNGSTAGTGFTWYEWLFLNFLTTDEIHIEHLLGPDNEYYEFHGQTFSYLVKQIFYETQNIRHVVDDELDELTEVVHYDLKSVFENISVTNTYLYDIKHLIKDLPDYSSDFKELEDAIENIDIGDVVVSVPDINIPEIDVSDIDIPDYGQELTNIQFLLENLELDVNVPASSFDDTDIIHYLSDINTTIKLMNSPIDVDDVVDVFDGLSDDEGMLDMGNFVMNAIATIHTGKVLNMAFTYMGSLSNGIGWINGHIQSIFDASDVFRGVILLGVTMFTVNLIVRRDA